MLASNRALTTRFRGLHPGRLDGAQVIDVSGAQNKCGPRAISMGIFGSENQHELIEELARERMLQSTDIMERNSDAAADPESSSRSR